ncbi:MAG: hypothetical protein HZR80_14700 [Candidatus Heimdallarchaeota archaeon]
MFKIKAITKQHQTEDPNKVATSLKTILDSEVQEQKIGNENYLYVESKDHASLENLHTLFRQYKILDVARKVLRNNIVDNTTVFFVNKQVAFTGKINFCEEIGESPLGPIRIEITYDNIDHLIDWLAPYTKNGREIKLVKKFP